MRNVYRLKVQCSREANGLVGRPPLLSPQCREQLKAFVDATKKEKINQPVHYYMHHFRRIIRECGDEERLAECKASSQFVRSLIKDQIGTVSW